ncbi:integrase, catalytic region, zinc finger, CCHC-type containing protein [Tanacetum coccineum]
MNHHTSSVPQIAYQSPQVTTQPMTESPLMDSSFFVPVFSLGDDPIACLNKAMAFLTAVASSRFPSTNNQLRTSSNPRNQATIQDGRVTVQQVQGRQGQSYSGTGYKSNATSSGGNNASGQARIVKCYNCQGEGHMARQCTQPKRPRNAAWYKEKAMLAEAQCWELKVFILSIVKLRVSTAQVTTASINKLVLLEDVKENGDSFKPAAQTTTNADGTSTSLIPGPMPLEQFLVNTKFLNTLPAEWSKFVTNVKLVKDLHTTNVDQIHAYLEQHERHANEVRLMHERNSDPLALVASHPLASIY